MIDTPVPSRRIVVTGAGRGLGLEFCRHWLAAGHALCALARRPGASLELAGLAQAHGQRLRILACDVTDDAGVASAAAAVAAVWEGVDLLVNNAGTFGTSGGSLEDLDLDEVRRLFEVNTLGPLRVTRALLPRLRKGSRPMVVHITSLMGSIGDNTSGGSWAYRLSKAALNMAGRNLAHDLAADGIPSVVLHPGWVRTDMGGPDAPLGVREAIESMAATIDRLTVEHSGLFLDRNGQPLPW